MAMMRTRTKSRGMCLCLLGIALALLVQPSTDFARGVPGLKEHAKRHPLHAGVARRAGAAQEDNSGQDRLDLEEVVAEAKRVVDNGTLKDMQVVMRRVQLVDPAGKWKVWVNEPELEKQLRKFVAEAKAAKTALEEDLLLARQQRKTGQRQVESAQRQVESAQRQVESAQRQVESAQRQVESAQRQVESAQEQEAMAVRRLARAATVLETAEDSGNATKVQEAKEEVEKAERKVERAERKVERAKKEVQEAKKEVEKAKKEVKEAKASGRTKESEASASSSLKWVVDAKDTAFANELRMAQPLTALDCADENFTDVESAEDAGIEIFPLNASLDPKEAKPWLFVRKQQREVWQAAFNASQDVVVTGSPGIGKSFSMSFLFRDLMKAKKTFVFEARRWNMVYLFKPRTDGTYEVGSMQLEDWKPAACDELRVPANYYVIDPGEAEKGGVCFVAAKTVICPSPDPQHLGEFKKLPKCKLYMAACSLQEAQCIVKYLRPNFDQNQVEELYRRFGGILRHLIGDPKEVEMARNATLSNQNLVRQVWTSGIIDQGRDLKPAHWLFQIVPENGCTSSRVEFVSEEALDLTIHEYEAELADLLTSFDPLAKPVLGVLYERFAHQVLCRGTLLLTRLANVTVPMFEMQLPPLDEEVVDGSIADLFTAATTGQLRYMRPRDVGLPVIDSCLAPVEDGVMTCFQITVSAKHSLDLVALENAARGLDIAKIVIYWVVPRDSFREFNRKQTFGPQLVFEQRVLSLAAPRNPFTEQEMQERLQKAELSKLTTGDEQLLKQEIDDLKLRYLVMKSFEEQDVKDIMNKVLKEGKRAKNQDPVALRAARAWDKIVACMAWTKKRGECKGTVGRWICFPLL
ncbi:unnamed protein product [Effrenium voratum]|uniref:Uncharacterized protein n=1 Tax=Effrenium voratum TaxID=2562239 RepID=A0AA36MLX7_9DINO|nr:unnamed protein product [Effrenium voratum]